MKKIFLVFSFLLITSLAYSAPYWFIGVSTTNAKATVKLSGDFKVYNTTQSASTSFEIVQSSITKVGSIVGHTVTGKLTAPDIESTSSLKCASLQVTGSATNGYILTSDVSGNATWQQSSTQAVTGLLASDNAWTGTNTFTANKLNLTPATTRYVNYSGESFIGFAYDNSVIERSQYGDVRSASTAKVDFLAGVYLPQGAKVISLKAYWYRTDISAYGQLLLYRKPNMSTSAVGMAAADTNASSGDHSVEDTSISYDTIDNLNYHYYLRMYIDPNDNADEVYFYNCVISYTITEPLP